MLSKLFTIVILCLQSLATHVFSKETSHSIPLTHARISWSKIQERRKMQESNIVSNLYTVPMGLSTPSVQFPAIIDTGSDLIWAPCNLKASNPAIVPCHHAYCKFISSKCSHSSCTYHYAYGSGKSSSNGVLMYNTLSFSTSTSRQLSVSNVIMGCSDSIQGIPQGVGFVGLGRGPLSLVSQIGTRINHKFSYCLSSNKGANSHLMFGDIDKNSLAMMKTTPLLQNPKAKNSPFYYLALEGISVGGQRLDIPSESFGFNSDGSGGVIMDSGSQLTYLHKDAYEAVKKALQSQVNAPLSDGSSAGLDLCYQPTYLSNSRLPDIAFHFRGADFVTPMENYMVNAENGLCLAMVPTELGFSIVGSIQQHNYHILLDNGQSSLSFMARNCDTI